MVVVVLTSSIADENKVSSGIVKKPLILIIIVYKYIFLLRSTKRIVDGSLKLFGLFYLLNR